MSECHQQVGSGDTPLPQAVLEAQRLKAVGYCGEEGALQDDSEEEALPHEDTTALADGNASAKAAIKSLREADYRGYSPAFSSSGSSAEGDDGRNSPSSNMATISGNVSPASNCSFTHVACSGAWSGQRAERPRCPPWTFWYGGSTPFCDQRNAVGPEIPAAAHTCAVVDQRGFALLGTGVSLSGQPGG